MRYMHRAGVVHRDMKPTNILLNRDCELALADLGLARYIGRPGNLGQGGGRNSDEYISAHGEEGEGSPPEADIDEITGRAEAAGAVGSGAGLGSLTKYVVTRWYRAPELLVQNQRYDASVDMWSLGCIVGELLGARALFPGRDSLHQLKLIVERLGAPTKDELAQVENEQVRSAWRLEVPLRSSTYLHFPPHHDTIHRPSATSRRSALASLRRSTGAPPSAHSSQLLHRCCSTWFPASCSSTRASGRLPKRHSRTLTSLRTGTRRRTLRRSLPSRWTSKGKALARRNCVSWCGARCV